ncbi:MAG TPA: DNA-binding protein [Opitutae bacterium]|nr:DNA-binding protein [Opitutae bacterium]
MSDWSEWQVLRMADAPGEATLVEILDGGQSFRWQRNDDGTWTGVFGRHIAQLRPEPEGIAWRQPLGKPSIAEDLGIYLDAAGKQARAIDALPWRSDPFLASALARFPGLRILAQTPDEALLAFLCSSNKQIIQIRRMVAALADQLGEKLAPDFHALPDWAKLARADPVTLKACGLGYRATFIQETAIELERRPNWAEELGALETDALLVELAKLPGVGPKVAACVALFGFGRLESFPVDTWIEQILVEGYTLKGWKRLALERFGRAHYGAAAGLAQQFLFAAARAQSKNPKS